MSVVPTPCIELYTKPSKLPGGRGIIVRPCFFSYVGVAREAPFSFLRSAARPAIFLWLTAKDLKEKSGFEMFFANSFSVVTNFIYYCSLSSIALTLFTMFYFGCRPVETKRHWHPYIVSGASLTFLWIALAIGCPPSALLFLVPGMVLISISNIRNVRFCDCGAAVYNRNWQEPHACCSRCSRRSRLQYFE